MKKTLLAVILLVSFNANSAVVIFENDFTQWSDISGSALSTIDFESIAAPSPVEISGNEFAGLPLSPNFTLVDGGGIFVGNPASGQVLTPTSGDNTLFPECNTSCEGIIRVTFDQDITSFGAFFIDVEADFSSTGFSLVLGNTFPEIAFSSFQGQNAQSFLGFISDTPFDSVDIHFTTGPNIDGTLIDDLSYSASPVPIPAASWLFISGMASLLGLSLRKK
jgi:hypothetical protein